MYKVNKENRMKKAIIIVLTGSFSALFGMDNNNNTTTSKYPIKENFDNRHYLLKVTNDMEKQTLHAYTVFKNNKDTGYRTSSERYNPEKHEETWIDIDSTCACLVITNNPQYTHSDDKSNPRYTLLSTPGYQPLVYIPFEKDGYKGSAFFNANNFATLTGGSQTFTIALSKIFGKTDTLSKLPLTIVKPN